MLGGNSRCAAGDGRRARLCVRAPVLLQERHAPSHAPVGVAEFSRGHSLLARAAAHLVRPAADRRNQRRRCVGFRSAVGVAAMPRGRAHRVLACAVVLFGTFLCRRVGQSTSGMLGLRSRRAHTRGRAAIAAECRFIAKWRRPAFVWGANSLLFEPGHRFVHFGYWAHYFMSDRHADDRFFRVLRVCARASVRAACLFVSLYFGCSCVCAMRCALRAARHYYQDGMASIKQFAIECAFAAVRFGALSACPSRNGRTD